MSNRQRLRTFLRNHRGRTSPAWRQQIVDRARDGARWPNPWQIAKMLDLDVRLVASPGLKCATAGSTVYLGQHADSRVLGHRLATAIAQHLLELTSARWSRDDVYLLAFELLMPSASVRETDPRELARSQPHAVPALVETWAEYVASSA
jgi:hypothetical protein